MCVSEFSYSNIIIINAAQYTSDRISSQHITAHRIKYHSTQYMIELVLFHFHHSKTKWMLTKSKMNEENTAKCWCVRNSAGNHPTESFCTNSKRKECMERVFPYFWQNLHMRRWPHTNVRQNLYFLWNNTFKTTQLNFSVNLRNKKLHIICDRGREKERNKTLSNNFFK